MSGGLFRILIFRIMNKKIILVVVVIVLIFFSYIYFNIYRSRFILSTENLRVPDEKELFFHKVAVDFEIPELCNKISSQAYYSAPFAPPGYQISLVRSRCFINVAEKMKDQNLCKEVRSISTL